jgi:hypothetical protein
VIGLGGEAEQLIFAEGVGMRWSVDSVALENRERVWPVSIDLG